MRAGANGFNVALSSGFWLGETPVTQAFYEAIMGVNPSHFQSSTIIRQLFAFAGFDGSQRPVENVSWYAAQAFCKTLTDLLRLQALIPVNWECSLPTEAQWEYACRAGTKSWAYNDFGPGWLGAGPDEVLDEIAWYLDNSSGSTHRVGLKRPNKWGFHDMQGNVWEWCKDWHDFGGFHRRLNSFIRRLDEDEQDEDEQDEQDKDEQDKDEQDKDEQDEDEQDEDDEDDSFDEVEAEMQRIELEDDEDEDDEEEDSFAELYPDTCDPLGPASGMTRVLRGGGWDSYRNLCGRASSEAEPPGHRSQHIGFRIAIVQCRVTEW